MLPGPDKQLETNHQAQSLRQNLALGNLGTDTIVSILAGLPVSSEVAVESQAGGIPVLALV